MRLVAVGLTLALFLVLVPTASAGGPDCTIDLHDPTNPVLYGDCIPVINEREVIPPGILSEEKTKASTIEVTVVLPDCAAQCDQASVEEMTVRGRLNTTGPSPVLVIEHEATGHLDPWLADLLEGSYRIE